MKMRAWAAGFLALALWLGWDGYLKWQQSHTSTGPATVHIENTDGPNGHPIGRAGEWDVDMTEPEFQEYLRSEARGMWLFSGGVGLLSLWCVWPAHSWLTSQSPRCRKWRVVSAIALWAAIATVAIAYGSLAIWSTLVKHDENQWVLGIACLAGGVWWATAGILHGRGTGWASFDPWWKPYSSPKF